MLDAEFAESYSGNVCPRTFNPDNEGKGIKWAYSI